MTESTGTTPLARLTALAKRLGVPKKQLLVMDKQTDPFNIGSPTDIAAAEWVARLYEAHPAESTHLRQLHYAGISDNLTMPNGQPYVNSDRCWKWLTGAAVSARVLGLVDPGDVTDERTKAWKWGTKHDERLDSYWDSRAYAGASMNSKPFYWESTPEIDDLLPTVSAPWSTGHYDYHSWDDTRIAVVVEKTGVDVVLVPLCAQYGLDLLSATGYVSHTRIREWLYRDTTRPARLLYVSDFDPAGDKMPRAFARQVEGMIDRYGLDVDYAVTPLALTAEQVAEYQLPTIPMKPTTDPKILAKQRKFKEQYGVEGAVELEAFQQRHPDELRRLILDEVEMIRDETLPGRCREARDETDELIAEVWGRHEPGVLEALEPVVEQRREAAEQLIAAYDDYRNLDVDTTEVERLLREAKHEMDGLDFPEQPTPDHEGEDMAAWLFHSVRDFMTQLAHYPK